MTKVHASQSSKVQSSSVAKSTAKSTIIRAKVQDAWSVKGIASGTSTLQKSSDMTFEQLASRMLGTKVAKQTIARSVRESVARETSLQSRDEQAFWKEVRAHPFLQSYSSSQITAGIKAYLAKRGPLAMPEMLFHETPAEMAKTIGVWIEHLVKNGTESPSKSNTTKVARSKAKASRKSA